MLTEEQAANAYEEVTDGCRRFGSDDERQCSAMAAGQAARRVASSGRTGRRRGDVGSSLCRTLLLCERVRALDCDHAFRLQLLGGDVDVHLAQPSGAMLRSLPLMPAQALPDPATFVASLGLGAGLAP